MGSGIPRRPPSQAPPARGRVHRLLVDVVTGGRIRATGLGRWLAEVAPRRAAGRMTVAIVTDSTMRSLNRRYRGIDATTDVLSFPGGEPAFLGDVAIALGTARRQADARRHGLQVELRVLALHGLLHLLGYDHESDSGEMRRLERRLRLRGGLREGLIERADA